MRKMPIIRLLAIVVALALALTGLHFPVAQAAIKIGPLVVGPLVGPIVGPPKDIILKKPGPTRVLPGKDILQKAVDDAKPGDTLVLTAGTYNGPYRGYYQERGLGGVYQKPAQAVEINKAITIRGEGDVIIKNNPFKITANNVTIENVTFQNTYGGGISIWSSANVTVKGCTFKENESRYGAGVYIEDSNSITVENCEFSGNDSYVMVGCRYNANSNEYTYTFAGSGGGAYIKGSHKVTFSNCCFKENIAYDSGGALVFEKAGSDCLVQNCTFNGNWTDKNGGALYSAKTEGLAVKNSSFVSNLSLPVLEEGSSEVKGYGGAVYSSASNLEVYNCQMRENKAYNGGAIYGLEGAITVDKSWFYRNEAKYLKRSNITSILTMVFTLAAGDIQGVVAMIAEMIMTKAACPQNVVFPWDGWESFGGQGGAIYTANTALVVKNSQLTWNASDKEGGAVYSVVGTNKTGLDSRFADTVFMYNKSQKGGAVASLARGAKFDKCTFTSNTAEAVGGGMYSLDSMTVTGSTFNRNRAPVGGGICSSLIGKTAEIKNCSFEENLASDAKNNGGGGALYAFGHDKNAKGNSVPLSQSVLNLSGNTFKKNGSKIGGAVSLVKLTGKLNGNKFTENGAVSGGGALNMENSAVNLETDVFHKNQSLSMGGALYNQGSTLSINRAEFKGNSSSTSGGGIFSRQGTFQAVNSLFTGNTSGAAAAGSVIQLEQTNKAGLVNCTIALNGRVPVAARQNTFLDIYNSIIVSNSVKENVSAADIYAENSWVNAKFNVCGQDSTTNIRATTDIFRKPNQGDFRIRFDFLHGYLGPLDGGNSDYFPKEKAPAGPVRLSANKVVDLAGKERFVDNSGDGRATIDMGAYEQDMVKVTFAAAHPLAGVAYGSISGQTEQLVPWGNAADASKVTVEVLPGWEFDGWETLNHTRITNLSRITGNLNLYALYKKEGKRVAVKYRFNPHQLQIAAGSPIKIVTSIDGLTSKEIDSAGILQALNDGTKQLTTYVKVGYPPLQPVLEGVNDWNFTGWSPWPPVLASQDTTVVATVNKKVIIIPDLHEESPPIGW